MLKVFNKLSVFFEDNYIELSVRDYAKKTNISPPTASKILNEYTKENLLKKKLFRKTHLFSANRSEKIFHEFQKLYFYLKFHEIGFINYLEDELYVDFVILFGSAVKGELRKKSDLDLVVITKITKTTTKTQKFEKKLGRTIQLFSYKNYLDIPKNLIKSIERGFVIYGEKE